MSTHDISARLGSQIDSITRDFSSLSSDLDDLIDQLKDLKCKNDGLQLLTIGERETVLEAYQSIVGGQINDGIATLGTVLFPTHKSAIDTIEKYKKATQ